MIRMILEVGEPEFNPLGKVEFGWRGFITEEAIADNIHSGALNRIIDRAAEQLKDFAKKEADKIGRKRKMK